MENKIAAMRFHFLVMHKRPEEAFAELRKPEIAAFF
jgi:hypothetical protein